VYGAKLPASHGKKKETGTHRNRMVFYMDELATGKRESA